jgi:hypothetical protein
MTRSYLRKVLDRAMAAPRAAQKPTPASAPLEDIVEAAPAPEPRAVSQHQALRPTHPTGAPPTPSLAVVHNSARQVTNEPRAPVSTTPGAQSVSLGPAVAFAGPLAPAIQSVVVTEPRDHSASSAARDLVVPGRAADGAPPVIISPKVEAFQEPAIASGPSGSEWSARPPVAQRMSPNRIEQTPAAARLKRRTPGAGNPSELERPGLVIGRIHVDVITQPTPGAPATQNAAPPRTIRSPMLARLVAPQSRLRFGFGQS